MHTQLEQPNSEVLQLLYTHIYTQHQFTQTHVQVVVSPPSHRTAGQWRPRHRTGTASAQAWRAAAGCAAAACAPACLQHMFEQIKTLKKLM
jgi:hypothetical protein